MGFEFCWQHRNCDRPCPVRESESIFCWRIAHRESFCHPDVCQRCSYQRAWFSHEYSLQSFLEEHERRRPRPKAQRILAVDDEPNFLFALEETIRGLGCTCLTAIDGAEGLFFAEETTPDLIVTDVQMPGIHGFDLCRRLKASPATAGIPIIIVSVRAGARDIEEGMAAGASAYLVKPLHPADLERHIRTLLPGEPSA
jgi:CheY-like chemotaxis protein